MAPGVLANVYSDLSHASELTGKNLDDLITRVGNYNDLYPGDPLNVHEFIQTMRKFDVPVEQWGNRLDEMNQASMDAGVPLSKILDTMNKAGPSVMQLGMNFQQSAALLNTFEDAGINTDIA